MLERTVLGPIKVFNGGGIQQASMKVRYVNILPEELQCTDQVYAGGANFSHCGAAYEELVERQTYLGTGLHLKERDMVLT